jgi:DNA-binding GntR family transcriptional regulator
MVGLGYATVTSEFTLAMPPELVNQQSVKPRGPDAKPRTSGEASSVDAVYEQILLQIVRGELAGGTELKSTQLAQQMGLSRTPVVQALQRLAADGIVTLELNKRAVVRPGAENWLVELHELRELLEPTAAARAAQSIEEGDIERLEALAAAARPHATSEWMAAAQEFDFALHLAIAERSGNFALGETIRKIWTFKRISYLAAPEPAETIERGYGEHLSLLSALRARDSETARAAMLFHLRSAASLRPSRTIV